jgi:hypothetical protein
VAAGTWDLTIVRGTDYEAEATMLDSANNTPLDWSDREMLAQIRLDADDIVVATFDVDKSSMGPTGDGKLKFVLDHDQSMLLQMSQYVWDLRTTDTDDKRRTVFAGSKVNVVRDVSKAA